MVGALGFDGSQIKKSPFLVWLILILVSYFIFPNNIYAVLFFLGIVLLMSLESLKMKILGPAYSMDPLYQQSWSAFSKSQEKKLNALTETPKTEGT